ncbi:hypothetical protein Patl1_20787 [Pistacia atlantica]|uniref:Uncharacterized protein n=1 Tax=Pistacia atlantica TaxID=434234 RepID=A0ACC1BNP4_9ROSI|nr:hypothetical protein Patl1_20787 [Pistacia atlantica]
MFASKHSQQPYNRKPKYPIKSHPQTFQPPYYPKKPAPNTQSDPSSQPNYPQQTFNTPRTPCQIYGKPNHQAFDCFHCMDYAFQGRHPPTQLAAMVAHTNATHVAEDPWFAKSGANQHITTNLEQLTLAQPYTGQEHVAVGNGQGHPNEEDIVGRIE